MVQPGEQEGLFAEALARSFIRQGSRGQDFDGDIAVQSLIVGAIEHAHATGPDLFQNPIV